MLLCFELSMPGVGSWNDGWSGSKEFYAKIVNFGKTKSANMDAKAIADKGYYSYDFGDGWRAGITVKAVDPVEAAKIRRRSSGFCNYDWMIDSIIGSKQIICPRGGKNQR